MLKEMPENPSLDQRDSADDVFTAIFDCFRQGLNAQDDFEILNHTWNTFHQLPHKRAIDKDSLFLHKLSHRKTALQCCIQAKIRQDTKELLQKIRQERKNSHLERQKRRERLSLASRMIQIEHEKALIDAQTQCMSFTQRLTHVEESSMERLKTLFFECIGEIQKATERVEAHSQDKKDDSSLMVRECQRQFAWKCFLQRLEEDIGGLAVFTGLFPPSTMDFSAVESQQFESWRPVIESFLTKKLATSFVPGEALKIQTIILVHLTSSDKKRRNSGGRSTDSSLIKSNSKPKLVMGASGEDAAASARHLCRETLKNLLSSELTHNNRRNLTKAKYQFVPDPDYQQEEVSSSSSEILRHIGYASSGTHITPFPCIECDIPLSSCYIQWIIQGNIGDNQRVWNTNIYFNIEEYRRNYKISLSAMLSAQESHDVHLHQTGGTSSTELSLMSFHQAMERLNEIFKKYEARLLRESGSTINTGRLDDTLVVYGEVEGNKNHKENNESGYFARANVLQLVQTVYYTSQFLSSLSFEDKRVLERMYPTLTLGKNILSTLYIPMVVTDQQDHSIEDRNLALSMVPLKDDHLHELLVTYVLRGKTLDVAADGSSGTFASLAQADAMSHLFPSFTMGHDACTQMNQTQICAIQNPAALLAISNKNVSSNPSTESTDKISKLKNRIEKLIFHENNPSGRSNENSPEILFIEYTITNQTLGSYEATDPNSAEDLSEKSNNRRKIQQKKKNKEQASYSSQQWDCLLGGKCYWRSCLAPKSTKSSHGCPSVEEQGDDEVSFELFGQRKGDLCSWHNQLCQFLPSDERQQYLPVIRQQQQSINTARCMDDIKEKEQEDHALMVRKLIQKSSSLLEEVQSGQLIHSLQAFFQHVTNGFSNTLDMKEILGDKETSLRLIKENKIFTRNEADKLNQDQRALQSRLASVRDLYLIEAEATKELQVLAHLMKSSMSIGTTSSNSWRELEEYDADIQTDDIELRLKLSQRKCELFRQRRIEEERVKRIKKELGGTRLLETKRHMETINALRDLERVEQGHINVPKRHLNKKERPKSSSSACSSASSSSSSSFSTRNIIRTKIRPQYLSQPPAKAYRNSEVRQDKKKTTSRY